jgi:hypothetical protein
VVEGAGWLIAVLTAVSGFDEAGGPTACTSCVMYQPCDGDQRGTGRCSDRLTSRHVDDLLDVDFFLRLWFLVDDGRVRRRSIVG